MTKLTTCLWFDKEAEDAAKFYASVFKDSKIGKITRYTEAGQEVHGQEPGSVLTVEFTLGNMDFIGLNGGPLFKFNEAVSFVIDCQDQEEVDYYWEKLSAVPESEQCGWCKDKFGLSWQVVPKQLNEMLEDPDKKKADAVMEAMLKMHKLDLAKLQEAYDSA